MLDPRISYLKTLHRQLSFFDSTPFLSFRSPYFGGCQDTNSFEIVRYSPTVAVVFSFVNGPFRRNHIFAVIAA